ncbi:MAG TPA: hypothetical protein VG537_02125 [Candidatus Kapabacteria bacterium]|jgi:hypothetical protein|nr:hypothetical protein [Candidatus Kapabacteria bacterium]
MKALCVYLFAIVLLASASSSRAQVGPPPYGGPSDYRGTVKIAVPYPSDFPPVRTDMPFDVLKGYIYLDSLVRSVNVPSGQCDSLIKSMGWDTLKYALKYLYEMGDYDPVAYFQELNLEPSTPAYQWTGTTFVVEAILRRAVALMKDNRIGANLVATSAIYDVNVTDTFTAIDNSKPSLNKLLHASCSILDIIKGQRFPTCGSGIATRYGKGKTPLTSLGDCVNFEYWLWWQKNIVAPDFRWNQTTENNYSDGSTWVKPGQEYIVFLNFANLGSDSTKTNVYVSVNPGFGPSTVMGVYPIRDGIVYDPNNDFGFGTGLTVADFKARLRQKIQSIVSF